MADTAHTRGAPSAHIPNSTPSHFGTFDPADWLARYTALGGVYVANGKLNLCILVNQQSEEELSQIRQIIVDLTDDQRATILAHAHAMPGASTPTWQDVVAKYEADHAAFSAHRYASTLTDDPNYDALYLDSHAAMDASVKSLNRLIVCPAPDHAALGHKIEIIKQEYGDSEGLFDNVLADVERLGRKLIVPANADREILAAWDRRAAAYTRYNALPFSENEGEELTPAEKVEWAIIDEAEAVIQSAVATTPAGVAAQVWTALQHSITNRDDDAALHRTDLAALEARGADLDWNVRLLVAALRSLKTMEG